MLLENHLNLLSQSIMILISYFVFIYLHILPSIKFPRTVIICVLKRTEKKVVKNKKIKLTNCIYLFILTTSNFCVMLISVSCCVQSKFDNTTNNWYYYSYSHHSRGVPRLKCF